MSTMLNKEKTVLYLTDLPYGIGQVDIINFLYKYKDDIAYINTDNLRNQNKGKPASIRVFFKESEIADKCRKEMNLKKLLGKSVRIMWVERDTTLRYNTKNNLYIKGIPKTTTPREVYEYFMQFGDIFSCKITEDDFGNHNGYGYITFYKNEDAEKAIESSKGKKIFDSNNVEIMHFQRKNERMINNLEKKNMKIYINNLPENYDKNDLKELCKEFGSVEECNIYSDKIGKKFGIVEFREESEAKSAMNNLDGKEIEKNGVKQNLIVQSFQNKFEHNQLLQNNALQMREQKSKTNLIIKNIPLTAKEKDLEKVFSKFGVITSIRIEMNKIEKKDEKGKFDLVSKGFGYILFDKPEEAKKAYEEMNQKYLPGFEGWSKPLDIDYFLTRYERYSVENQNNNNISNYFYMNQTQKYFQNSPAPLPPQSLVPGAMQIMPAPPMPMPYAPMIQFNNIRNYNYNNNYRNNKRNWRGKKNNYMNNNNRNNYGKYNKNNNYDNKEKEEDANSINAENKIDLSEFEKLKTDEEKRNFFGEKVYRTIEESQIALDRKLDADDIARITGMIINIPYQEIIETLEDTSILNNRIEEALNLLNK